MSVVITITVVLLGAAALFSIIRIVRGPSILDRVVASDVLIATVMCAIGAEMAFNKHSDGLPVLLALAMFAIVGSVSVARFMANQDDA